jgi:hypothetical protein
MAPAVLASHFNGNLPPCSRAPPAIRAACLALAQMAAALAQAPFFIRPVTFHALTPPSQRQELRPVEHLQPALGDGLQRSVYRRGSPRISVRAFPLHSGKAQTARDLLPAVATHRFCCRRGRTPAPPRAASSPDLPDCPPMEESRASIASSRHVEGGRQILANRDYSTGKRHPVVFP